MATISLLCLILLLINVFMLVFGVFDHLLTTFSCPLSHQLAPETVTHEGAYWNCVWNMSPLQQYVKSRHQHVSVFLRHYSPYSLRQKWRPVRRVCRVADMSPTLPLWIHMHDICTQCMCQLNETIDPSIEHIWENCQKIPS